MSAALRTAWLLLLAVVAALAGCQRAPDYWQGYAEGEFVYVASPRAGQLQELSVERGQQVEAGAPLFTLDPQPEASERQAAQDRVVQVQAALEDAKKGLRESELQSLEAQIAQNQASVEFWTSEVSRLRRAFETRAVSREELERGVSTLEQEQQAVARLQADLATAKLGSREDQIAAAAALLAAQQAALAEAVWNLEQKSQAAPKSGLVFDTLYREGEWIGAGKPAVILLPPANIKVRAFVPQPQLGALRVGDAVEVTADGMATSLTGHLSYIAPRAEYTPPVIYSRDTRDKLLYLVEVRFDPADAVKLHPGQPVEVRPKARP